MSMLADLSKAGVPHSGDRESCIMDLVTFIRLAMYSLPPAWYGASLEPSILWAHDNLEAFPMLSPQLDSYFLS